MSIAGKHFGAEISREAAQQRGSRSSTDDWERQIGEQLRRARLDAGFDQAGLADAANVSIGALRNLERGNGSTLKTLVCVARALGREDWLGSLNPAISVSPIDVLRSGRQPRSRVYRTRQPRVANVTPANQASAADGPAASAAPGETD